MAFFAIAQRLHGVSTASLRCAMRSHQQRCVRAMCALCRRIEYNSAAIIVNMQNKRRGLAFAQRPRQSAVGTL